MHAFSLKQYYEVLCYRRIVECADYFVLYKHRTRKGSGSERLEMKNCESAWNKCICLISL